MILYFSGTGNSRFAARMIADETGDRTQDAADYLRSRSCGRFTEPGNYVFVFPAHAGSMPHVFLELIQDSEFPRGAGAYFVITCAGGAATAAKVCRDLASEKGFRFMGAAEVVMPQNYIAYFKMGTPEKNRSSVREAMPKIQEIAEKIRDGEEIDTPKTVFPGFFGKLVGSLFSRVISAMRFHADERCVRCGKCASACPLGNIEMRETGPVWGGRCTHCMACINLCPVEAVEYGSKTAGKERYHGPESLR